MSDTTCLMVPEAEQIIATSVQVLDLIGMHLFCCHPGWTMISVHSLAGVSNIWPWAESGQWSWRPLPVSTMVGDLGYLPGCWQVWARAK